MADQRIRRALLSVSDKTGLVAFAPRSQRRRRDPLDGRHGAQRLSDGADSPSTDVAELTGFPEMMDGRVKTLHPKVHGGLLAIRGNAEHDEAALTSTASPPIDLLVVNLYPFEATVATRRRLRRRASRTSTSAGRR